MESITNMIEELLSYANTIYLFGTYYSVVMLKNMLVFIFNHKFMLIDLTKLKQIIQSFIFVLRNTRLKMSFISCCMNI